MGVSMLGSILQGKKSLCRTELRGRNRNQGRITEAQEKSRPGLHLAGPTVFPLGEGRKQTPPPLGGMIFTFSPLANLFCRERSFAKPCRHRRRRHSAYADRPSG